MVSKLVSRTGGTLFWSAFFCYSPHLFRLNGVLSVFQEVLEKEEEISEGESEEESSEYEEYSESDEEMGPRLKPVFVRK
jgi:hypothetical protein